MDHGLIPSIPTRYEQLDNRPTFPDPRTPCVSRIRSLDPDGAESLFLLRNIYFQGETHLTEMVDDSCRSGHIRNALASGCAHRATSVAAYVEATKKLQEPRSIRSGPTPYHWKQSCHLVQAGQGH